LISLNTTVITLKIVSSKEIETGSSEDQEEMSDDMKNMTAVEGSKLSSSDVQQVSLSIDTLINLPNSELSNSTVDNLISTIDNIQTNTDVKELQDEQASDELRESAVAIIRAVARQNDNNVLKTEESIGLNEFLSKTFIIKYYLGCWRDCAARD